MFEPKLARYQSSNLCPRNKEIIAPNIKYGPKGISLLNFLYENITNKTPKQYRNEIKV